jgi:ubiquinol-cytochrome c reductase cytochrome b subunit
VARIEQVVPAGWFIRGFHHVAGQLLLIGAVAHTVSVLARRRDEPSRERMWRWAKSVLLVPLAVLGCFTGFVLRGSAEGFDAATVATGLAASVPLIGDVAARSFFRPDGPACPLLLPYVHHLATATAGLMYLASGHVGQLRRRPASLAWTAALIALLALIIRAPTGMAPDSAPEVVHGPWFFVGIQWLLRFIPPLVAGIGLPLSVLVALALTPLTRGRARTGLLAVLTAAAMAYAAVSALGWWA